MNSDITLALILSSHIDGNAGVSTSVEHLSLSDSEESAIAKDLNSWAGSQRPAIFQPGDSRPGHTVSLALQSDVSSTYHCHVVFYAAWWANRGTNYRWQKKKYTGYSDTEIPLSIYTHTMQIVKNSD